MTEIAPSNPNSWGLHIDSLLRTSDFDAVNEIGPQIPLDTFDDNAFLAGIYQQIGRTDVDLSLKLVRRVLARPSPTPEDYYQSHRVFLTAGLVDEAARLVPRYEEVSTQQDLVVMVKMRQACAENRVADANALLEEMMSHAQPGEISNLKWLALQTLGRKEEAIEEMIVFDTPETLFALSTLLGYLHFDPTPYPVFNQKLIDEGAERTEVREPAYFCKRQVK